MAPTKKANKAKKTNKTKDTAKLLREEESWQKKKAAIDEYLRDKSGRPDPAKLTKILNIIAAGKEEEQRKTIARAFEGRWRITHMSDFDDTNVDGPAFIEFDKKGSGSFQCVAISGQIDVTFIEREVQARAEFCWAGFSERDEMSGRGEAVLGGDTMMAGVIWIFQGDSYAFVAEKMGTDKVKKVRR